MSLENVKLRFLSSTPQNVLAGSGTYTGIRTLAEALRAAGHEVDIRAPRHRFPVYTLQRLWFNRRLRARDDRDADIIVGFDLDGYTVAGRGGPPHVAAIKGVIADEMRFERGLTRRTLAIQAAREALHVRRADLTLTTSRYASARIHELYGLAEEPAVVPEPIDLAGWRAAFRRNFAAPDPNRFSVLCVCRFYPRKRVHLLVSAAAALRHHVPGLQVRIVGRGPEEARLHRLARDLNLSSTLCWLGDVSKDALAAEYNRADLFCLPSVQEGFGIVFLEAMAAAKPIVAARAAAVSEVVEHGLLVEPESADALAAAIDRLYRDPALAGELGRQGALDVERYGAGRVAAEFVQTIERRLGKRVTRA